MEQSALAALTPGPILTLLEGSLQRARQISRHILKPQGLCALQATHGLCLWSSCPARRTGAPSMKAAAAARAATRPTGGGPAVGPPATSRAGPPAIPPPPSGTRSSIHEYQHSMQCLLMRAGIFLAPRGMLLHLIIPPTRSSVPFYSSSVHLYPQARPAQQCCSSPDMGCHPPCE